MDKTILIVEDDRDLLGILSERLKSSGFGVLAAKTAESGYKLALDKRPDLILLDIILPKMDGLTMLKKLREDHWGQEVPVIVLSNLNDSEKISEAMEIGVYDFLLKTNLKLKELVDQITEALAIEGQS